MEETRGDVVQRRRSEKEREREREGFPKAVAIQELCEETSIKNKGKTATISSPSR